MTLIFIGMPGCGKTTLSHLVAEKLDKPWFDSDAEIEKHVGRSIPDIFAQDGEDAFRRMETERITEILKQENIVLAVGGGAVERNAALLRDSGFVIYIERPIPEILKTLKSGARPLLEGDAEARLRALYERRYALYEQTCHARVDNGGSQDKAVESVLRMVDGRA